MNEDQLRQEIDDILEGHLHQLHAGGVSVRDVKEEAYPQLTDLAVRFARAELEKIQRAPRGEAHNRAVRRLATLGEPEKTCGCTTSDGRYIRCDKHRTQWSSSNGGSPQ